MNTFNSYTKKLWLAIVLCAGLIGIAQTIAAGEPSGSQGMTGAMKEDKDIKYSPSFQFADKNGDHYVTKSELKDYPHLLKHFDKVDAGEDGKLEEHEYENLILEKEREKGM